MADEEKEKEKKPAVEKEKSTWESFQEAFFDSDKDTKDPKDPKEPKKKKGPPIYEPGPYPIKMLAALVYVVPIADSFDLGKYMFEAYPDALSVYNTLYGPIASVYNSKIL